MEYKTTAVIIFMTVTNSAALAPLPYFPSTDNIPAEIQQQYEDNLRWLGEADKHEMVVGSQARILYSDQVGRVKIAKAFNEAVATGNLKVSQVLCQILAVAIIFACFEVRRGFGALQNVKGITL